MREADNQPGISFVTLQKKYGLQLPPVKLVEPVVTELNKRHGVGLMPPLSPEERVALSDGGGVKSLVYFRRSQEGPVNEQEVRENGEKPQFAWFTWGREEPIFVLVDDR